MAKKHFSKTKTYYEIISEIQHNVNSNKIIKKNLSISNQNLTNKLTILEKNKLISRTGKNKGSKSSINYPGTIEYICKEILQLKGSELINFNYSDKILIKLLKYYMANLCFSKELLKNNKKLNRVYKKLAIPSEEFTLYSFFEGFVLGFGKAYLNSLGLNNKGEYRKESNIKTEFKSYFLFKLYSVDYFFKKLNSIYIDFISNKINDIEILVSNNRLTFAD